MCYVTWFTLYIDFNWKTLIEAELRLKLFLFFNPFSVLPPLYLSSPLGAWSVWLTYGFLSFYKIKQRKKVWEEEAKQRAPFIVRSSPQWPTLAMNKTPRNRNFSFPLHFAICLDSFSVCHTSNLIYQCPAQPHIFLFVSLALTPSLLHGLIIIILHMCPLLSKIMANAS